MVSLHVVSFRASKYAISIISEKTAQIKKIRQNPTLGRSRAIAEYCGCAYFKTDDFSCYCGRNRRAVICFMVKYFCYVTALLSYIEMSRNVTGNTLKSEAAWAKKTTIKTTPAEDH